MKDLSMHVMDILQNSTRAKAKNITLEIIESIKDDTMTILFVDDGCGMDENMVKNVTDPFFTTRTTRKVGLGLPLLKQNAERSGGYMTIESEVGKGTSVKAVFGLTNIDRPPMGDMPSTVVFTAAANPDIHFYFHYNTDKIDYVFDTDEVNEALEGVPINNPEIIDYLCEMIKENMQESE